MTEKLFRKIMEEQSLAQKVMEVKQDEFAAAYTEAEVEDAFNKGIETYGQVSVRSYTFSVETAEEGAKPTDDEKAAAKSKAETFASKITDEESFKTLAKEYAELAGEEDADTFLTDDSLTLSADAALSTYSMDEDLLSWVKTAKAGETYVAAGDSTSTVYYMVAPLHKAADEKTYDVRHILIKFPEADEKATDGDAKKEVEVKEFDASKYEATVVNAVKDPITDAESYNKAIEVLTSYLEGDKTEDAFAKLAKLHSEDGNAADGGIYEGVTIGKMVPEFEGWALDETRKAGDVGIVETPYGYHIMYFIKSEKTTWSDVIRNDLAAEDYNKLAEEIEKADNVKIDGKVDAALLGVEEFIVSLAKEQIRNINANAGHSADDGHDHG